MTKNPLALSFIFPYGKSRASGAIMGKISKEVALLNTVRFHQVAAVAMFGIAGVFLWFCFGSVVWHEYAFTFAMAVISGIAGVTAWMSAKQGKDWLKSQKLYEELCDAYKEIFDKNQELCDKNQELCDAYKELCGTYEELCDKYQAVFDAYQKKNSRPEE